MATTITGVPSTSILASCSGPGFKQPITSAFVCAYLQALCDDIASIKAGAVTLTAVKTFSAAPVFAAGAHVSQSQSLTADGTGATIAGAWTASGVWLWQGGGATFDVDVSVSTGRTLAVTSGSTLRVRGRKTWDRTRVVLTDAAHTIDVTQGDRFELPDSVAPRIITLDETTGSPFEGERLTFFAKNLTSTATQWTFKTSGTSNVVALFAGSAVNAIFGTFTWATYELVSGVWRLAENSGQAYDGVNVYGCLAGVATHP